MGIRRQERAKEYAESLGMDWETMAEDAKRAVIEQLEEEDAVFPDEGSGTQPLEEMLAQDPLCKNKDHMLLWSV